MSFDMGAIREGACPECRERLELHDGDHGRCPHGHGCWSTGADTVIVHFHGQTYREGSFTFTSPRTDFILPDPGT